MWRWMLLPVVVLIAGPLLWLMALHDGVVEHVLWLMAVLLLAALYDCVNPAVGPRAGSRPSLRASRRETVA